MQKAPLSETVAEALFHLSRPSASSHLAALSPEFCQSKKSGLPPSVHKAILAFSASENNLFLNPSLLTTESARPEEEGLLESAVATFVAAMGSVNQAGPTAQPPISTVAHDRLMLTFGRTYGNEPAPDCSRGADCAVNRVRMSPPDRCLQLYLTPAEHAACLEDPAHLKRVGPGLCLLCIRSCVAATAEYYQNSVSNVDQLPRQCGVPLPCSNLIDCAGGYRSETFGPCTPLGVGPAITTHCLVGPAFDLLRCEYCPHAETWRVDQSMIECAFDDANVHLLEPLYTVKRFASAPTELMEMAQLLELRLDAIYNARKPGIEYYVALVMQLFVPAVLYAREHPECTLADLYANGLAPEQQTPRYAIESNFEFLDIFRSAISDSAGSVALPSVRFVRKVLRAKVSSIRYLNQHATAMLALGKDTVDHRLVVAFSAHSLLGSLPHATSIAPPSIVIDFFENPVASTAKLIQIAGSKGLYSLLAEYISEVTYQYPDVFELMMKLDHQRLPKPSDDWLRAADKSVRPVIITNFFGMSTSCRRQLKNIPQPPLVHAMEPMTYLAEKSGRGIKRKLGATIISRVTAPVASEIYKTALARIQRKPRIPRDLTRELAARHGIDEDVCLSIMLHAIEQRGAFSISRAPRAVAAAQRKAHGGACPVKICVFCHSIRERVRDLKANKSTGEYVLHDASALTALDPPFTRPAAVNGVTALGPKYQCSNCQMRGSICEIDAIGLYFRSFQRHVDREPAISTVCADCGRLAVPRAIHGNLPICSGCHKKRQTTRKEAKCFACHARIHPAAVRVTAPVVPAFGFYTHPQAETFCHSCSKLADPKLPCSKQEIKSLTQSF